MTSRPGAGREPRVVHVQDPGDAQRVLGQIHRLVDGGIDPDQVRWQEAGSAQLDLLGGSGAAHSDEYAAQTLGAEAGARGSPADDLMRSALLHSDDARLASVHRLAAHLRTDPRAWADSLHPARLEVERLAKAVGRDIHKMHAFVRFRRCGGNGELRYLSWFEPRHHVVRAAAGFFRRRFATMHWAILTPRGSVSWDLQTLRFGPPATRDQAPPADAGERLWIAYYESIFNPARVKVAMMKREMPVAYWASLPEVGSIARLLHASDARVADMRTVKPASEVAQRRMRDAADTASLPAGRPTPTVPPGAVPGLADLQSLARQAAACDRCELHACATQTVWGEGPSTAALMIVGEQPGDEEDLRGRPFVGPAGRLLRDALRTLGWREQELYITNAVKHFHHQLRGKRRIHKTPAQRHVLACLEWLEAEIRALRPRVILALGTTARSALLYGGPDRSDGIPVVCALHPAALLRRNIAPSHPAMAAWLAQLDAASPYRSATNATDSANEPPAPAPSPSSPPRPARSSGTG